MQVVLKCIYFRNLHYQSFEVEVLLSPNLSFYNFNKAIPHKAI